MMMSTAAATNANESLAHEILQYYFHPKNLIEDDQSRDYISELDPDRPIFENVYKFVHSNDLSYTYCPLCEKKLNRLTIENIVFHFKKHLKKLNCTFCFRPFVLIEERSEHEKFCLKNPFLTGGKLFDEINPQNIGHLFNIRLINESYIENFRTFQRKYRAQLKPGHRFEGNIANFDVLLTSLLEKLFSDIPANNKIHISIDSSTIDYPIIFPGFLPVNYNDSLKQKWLDEISRVSQSERSLDIGHNMYINIIETFSPNGGKRKSIGEYISMEDALIFKKSLYCSRPQNDLCFAHAINILIAHYNQDYAKLRKLTRNDQNMAFKNSEAIATTIKVNLPIDKMVGAAEWSKFQEYYSNFQIIIWRDSETMIYLGPFKSQKIHIFFHESASHYYAINNIIGFLKRKKFCNACCVTYNVTGLHTCPGVCSHCHVKHKIIKSHIIYCSECNIEFFGNECFENHKKTKQCAKLKKCAKCEISYNAKKGKHECGRWCKRCKCHDTNDDHLCFIQKIDLKDEKINSMIFFDFECLLEPKYYETVKNRENTRLHVPFLCVAHIVKSDENGVFNQYSEFIFEGQNCLELFMAKIYEPEYHKSILIAHNSSSYDSVFIIKYLLKECKKFSYIPKTTRYLFIKLLDIGSVIVDSYNFLGCALSKLPAIFDLNHLFKPFFPYKYPNVDNYKYIGPWPSVEYYEPEFMKEKERLNFLIFYESVKNRVFNLRNELIEYCKSDVSILRESVIAFRQQYLDLTKMDVFASNVFTLSRFAMRFLKTYFLEPKTIAIISGNGFYRQQRQSVLASQFLRFYEVTHNVILQKHGNLGEKKILQYYVDGYDEKNSLYIDVMGCSYHGHPLCFKNPQQIGPTGKTMQQIYHETEIRIKKIQKTGVKYIYFWECEINRNIDFQNFCKTHEYVEKLKPASAYYGGRVSTFKMQCDISKIDINKNYKIEYYDFTSLYAFILRNGTIPLGYPKIILNPPHTNINDYFGLIQADILVNDNCYSPTIPYRYNKKLFFPICRTCLKEKQKTKCNHTQHERYLRGTWWSEELMFALEHDQIRILKLHEIWHFERRGVGYFQAYVDFFTKLKVESSAPAFFPVTIENAQIFCDTYLKEAGIKLDPKEVIKQVNEGRRKLAKDLVNCIYGKLGMKINQIQHTLVYNLHDFYDIIYDDRRVITNILFPHSDFVSIIHWRWVDNFVLTESTAEVNTICALAITSQARIHLHKEILKLKRQIIYCDTDSILFLSHPNSDFYKPKIGKYIGDFKNEIEKDNWIILFLSGCPKNYYFLYHHPLSNGDIEKYATKGIKLTFHAKKIITGSEMQRLISNFHCSPQKSESLKILNPNYFYRDSEYNIWCLNQTKKFQVNYDKRRVLNNIQYFDGIPIIDTVPWGFNMEHYSTIL